MLRLDLRGDARAAASVEATLAFAGLPSAVRDRRRVGARERRRDPRLRGAQRAPRRALAGERRAAGRAAAVHRGGPGAVAARRRAVDKFGEAPAAADASIFPLELDEYQIEALRHLRNDSNVIVSAPTGSGKTVAGELAIANALAHNTNRKGFRMYQKL